MQYKDDCKIKIDGSEATDFKTFKEIIGMYIYDDYMYIATRKDVYKINMKINPNRKLYSNAMKMKDLIILMNLY